MGDATSAAVNLPRRFFWGHPFWFVACALEGILFAGLGTAVYVAAGWVFGLRHPPWVSPILAITIGLAGGFAVVAAEGWRRRRYLETEVRGVAFGGLSFVFRLTRALPTVAIFAATLAASVVALHAAAGLLFMLTMAGLYTPLIFLYNSGARILQRAIWLFLQSEDRPGDLAVLTARPEPRWVNPFGAVCVMGLLGLGAWLQWGAPMLGESEPRTYETKNNVSGTATRLTYGADATDPSLSPDGRFIAYRKRIGLFNARLAVMRADGSGKRLLTGETGPSPTMFGPLNWSPDGKRILFVGEKQRRPATDWRDAGFLDGYKPALVDLWVIDVTTDATQRVAAKDYFIAGIWLPAARKIAAVTDTRSGKWMRLWLMDETGRNRHRVDQVKLWGGGLPQPWHGGRDVVAVGTEESVGIWSVNATSGKAVRISDMKTRLALPLNDRWLLVAVRGRPLPPFRRAMSVGVLDVPTGKVHWVVRDIQGSMRHVSLAAKSGVVVFSLWLDDNQNLWALRLKDGRIEKLTRDQQASRVAVAPDGKAVFYQAYDPESKDRSWWGLGEAIWRLDPGRPLGAG